MLICIIMICHASTLRTTAMATRLTSTVLQMASSMQRHKQTKRPFSSQSTAVDGRTTQSMVASPPHMQQHLRCEQSLHWQQEDWKHSAGGPSQCCVRDSYTSVFVLVVTCSHTSNTTIAPLSFCDCWHDRSRRGFRRSSESRPRHRQRVWSGESVTLFLTIVFVGLMIVFGRGFCNCPLAE